MRALQWAKPFTTALTRDQIRDVVRIYLVDRKARHELGYVKGTRGLRKRLAKEFGVKPKLIQDITDRIGRRRTDRFRDINIQRESTYARQRKFSLDRYRRHPAAAGSE